MVCPNCHGNNVQLVKEVNKNSTGYGAGSGCCGYILFGPIGLLCGLCGSGQSVTETHYYTCGDCNLKFKR